MALTPEQQAAINRAQGRIAGNQSAPRNSFGVISTKPTVAPIPTGYGAPGAPPLAATQGGPNDPAVIQRNEAIKAAVAAGYDAQKARMASTLDLQNWLAQQKFSVSEESKKARPLYNVLDRGVSDLRKQYEKNFKGVGIGSLWEYLPTPQAGVFNSTADRLAPSIKRAMELMGGDTNAASESARMYGPWTPSSMNFDAKNESIISNLEKLRDDMKTRYGYEKKNIQIKRVK